MELLKNRVAEKISSALDLIQNIPDKPAVRIEYAREDKFGDYACTIAMDKRFRDIWSQNQPQFKNPKNFAQAIVDHLQIHIPEFFAATDIAGPGFINLTLSAKILAQYLKEALESSTLYGHTQKDNPRKVIFEFVSANPTGPLNIVSARAAALGDSCCNLLQASGEIVHREYYVNDFGNQISLLGYSSLLRYAEVAGIPVKFAQKDQNGNIMYKNEPGLPFPAEGYHGEYLTQVISQIFKEQTVVSMTPDILEQLRAMAVKTDCIPEFYKNKSFAKASGDLGQEVLSRFLSIQKQDLMDFKVEFDEFFLESELHQNNQVMEIRNKFQNDIVEREGKEFFTSTKYNDDKDRVIVREDGRPTYLLADIAYHDSKFQRGYDQVYNIWGPDHHGYIARLAGALQSMGYEKERFKVLIAQQVNLLENGEQVKMSKRAGKVITMRELIDEIPVDVARYFFAMRSFESHLDFDLAQARDTSEKNPYYYVAYAHARIQSIFRKLKEQRKLTPANKMQLPESFDQTIERRKLLWLVARFPEEVCDAGLNLEPHRLINYLYSLASALSTFYARKENRIISQDETTSVELLTLLAGVSICLKNGLQLLGMTAPDKM